MKGYVKYLVVPIVALLLLVLRLLVGAARGPLPPVLVEVESAPGVRAALEARAPSAASAGDGSPARSLEAVLREATVAAGVARLTGDRGEARGRIIFVDRPGAEPPGLPESGCGALLVLGYGALADPSRRASPRPLWTASYLPRLEEAPVLAPGAVARWQLAEARPWDLRGAGLLLERLEDGLVLALRRGVELDRNFLEALPGRGVDAPGSLLGGRFLVVEPPPPGARLVLGARFSFLPAGEALARATGLPGEFPLAWVDGETGTWHMALEPLEGPSPRKEGLSPLFPGLSARTALDEPLDQYARFRRIVVPLWRLAVKEALELGRN